MFLQQLPEIVRWAVLFVVGAAAGGLINLAVYRLSFYRARNISPWSPPAADQPPRTWADRIPVMGWLFMRREADQHGRAFWIRPLLIELAAGVGLVWFYEWQTAGGLFGMQIDQLNADQVPFVPTLTWGWFLFHAVLLALLAIATFIDFDDQTIPDWVTVPGTVFALVMLAIAGPSLSLPTVVQGMGPIQLVPLAHWSPGEIQPWYLGIQGLVVGLATVVLWCFALVPKWTTFRYGLVRGVRIWLASMWRPARKTHSTVIRIQPRAMLPQTKLYAGLALLLCGWVLAWWSVGGPAWTALFDSLLGLAMGGGIVWAVRIVAGRALGVEAMGFGDVTLMCMIGAFLGWQPALLVFVIAPFTSIIVALVQLILTKENRLAFGPYLCLATVIVLIGWNEVWNQRAAVGAFQVGGGIMVAVILACLVLMAVMLGIWGGIKRQFSNGENR